MLSSSSSTNNNTLLTEEQKARIEQNRQRALEIQRQRKLQQEQEQSPPPPEDTAANDHHVGRGKRQKKEHKEDVDKDNEDDDDDAEEWEEFERGGTTLELVTKREAMQLYCLPEGTLAVCSFVEKENPHRKGWTPMKLYHRKELRKWARKRFGGVQGLQEERRKRQERQFQKDMERSKQIFETKK